jgi:hypothetical protein
MKGALQIITLDVSVGYIGTQVGTIGAQYLSHAIRSAIYGNSAIQKWTSDDLSLLHIRGWADHEPGLSKKTIRTLVQHLAPRSSRL